ncbi:ABC transporter ATP-binding protein [Acanthopleuribacter pedis]|uniref:ABC transporter ATP-binding protein n=1 Tax=Acanthopleuribacter pedis TaxID=442870 RepID=A0A8J7U3F9_9BACT|nr:ABC transporter ATP-binding protein [Acanthopleuribacter pedis]MBO1318719.1 ABC transporter ATP-binding protein [Acanthopleuribacter pedis]
MQIFWRFSKRYLRPYLHWYLAGFACIFLTQGMAVLIINTVKNAIDAVTLADADAQTVVPYAVKIALFAVSIIVVRTASRLLVFTPGRLIEYHVRNDYYQNLLFLQRGFFQRHESGDLVSRCSNDISFVRAAYGFGFLQIANVTITLTLGIGAMFAMDWRTTLYLAVPMILAFTIIQVSINYMLVYWRLANEQVGGLSSLCLSAYKGVSAIQNYHAEPAVLDRFRGINADYLHTQTVVTRVRSFIMPMVQLVGNLSVFIVLLIVAPKVLQGDLTLGELNAFLGYIAMIMPPLLSLGWMLNTFNRAVPAMERLEEIITAEPDLPKTVAETSEKPRGAVTISARDLAFRFPEDPKNPEPFELKPVSLEITPGKVVGVAGPLGSGKSVFLETLLRLNRLEPGRVLLNGDDGAVMELNRFRAFFSFAPQKPLLFSTTLRENLLVALTPEDHDQPDVEQRLRHALAAACFDLDPKVFPKGLETEVGVKGVMLSGGQRQRIALARALLKEADLYVLDDVLSAVDHETEKKIIQNLRRMEPKRSFLIASHRISAIQWADEILVFEQGSVVQRGNHAQLIQQPGFYQDIYQYQAEHPDE